MTDPDLQAAVDRAAEHLGRRLAAIAPLADPVAAARQWIEQDLMDGPDRWRPVPAGPNWRQPARPPDPETTRRGAELAREALRPREDR